jgi:hypothetical protein
MLATSLAVMNSGHVAAAAAAFSAMPKPRGKQLEIEIEIEKEGVRSVKLTKVHDNPWGSTRTGATKLNKDERTG